MDGIPANVKQIIADLADNNSPILNSNLAELSNLSSEELIHLERVCATMDLERRRKIISILVALAEENFELCFDSIFKLCLKDKDPEIRAKAIEGLWEDEEPSLINPLVRILNEDSSEMVQEAAASALGKFALLAELGKLRPTHAANLSTALLTILSDKNKSTEVRRRALEAAAPLSFPKIREAIQEAYQSSDPHLKASAIYSMGKNCNSLWVPILLKELSNPNSRMRYEAAGACGELCDKEAVLPLIELTSDIDLEVQTAAIQALGKIGGAKAKRCLTKCLDSTDDVICETAEQALKQLESEESNSFTF